MPAVPRPRRGPALDGKYKLTCLSQVGAAAPQTVLNRHAQGQGRILQTSVTACVPAA